MTVRVQRKRFRALADQLRSGKGLSQEQNEYLCKRFDALGRGEDANSAFGLAYTQGRSEVDEKRRENLRFIFSWIVAKMDPVYGDGYSANKALQAAACEANKKGSLFRAMTYSALRNAWYNKKYQYLRDPILRPLDINSPINY